MNNVNYYHCTACAHEWKDFWDCEADDLCANCHEATSPFHSMEIPEIPLKGYKEYIESPDVIIYIHQAVTKTPLKIVILDEDKNADIPSSWSEPDDGVVDTDIYLNTCWHELLKGANREKLMLRDTDQLIEVKGWSKVDDRWHLITTMPGQPGEMMKVKAEMLRCPDISDSH